MSLFQTSVLKNYISLQEDAIIEKAYKKYVTYFLNPTIQENIRGSKEEEYQGIFLTELFVNILGYTLKPKANFNLVAEYKNQTNSRKADGAILNNNVAVGVIELKGTNTKDLESIRRQAFDYKANQKGCVYVVTSNFEKLRFYINDATEFEEFNLFELTRERFQLFYLCLQKDNIINNIPLQIKEASVVQEGQITKDFYKDYSLFKRELYRDLVKQNAKRLKSSAVISSEVEKSQEQIQLEKNVKLTLFKKSQKLIDRFLFIFFAEDRNLLPANSTIQILEDWNKLKELDAIVPLYDRFKLYFKFLDEGRAGTNKKAEIYAYNGGLFKQDAILNSLIIDDELLYKHTQKLANYDFASQVDVNILGHIFENSLNEIESVNAEIEGAAFDKQKSKRKKDGVFYTPKYITKYIVENTVGKLCIKKKTELGIKEEEYFKGRKNRNKSTITKLVALLDTYRDWLLKLTICDPACGSGAFLNQALNFLIAEHNYIDELKTKVLGGGFQFPDIENTILENNIFGVDLNEESVEIAKLSLWLRTAQPRRKLNDLSSNIKCGNSLIDSKTVAGDKAFSWENEFPQVFDKGGFDVIIGNPPYLRKQGLIEHYPMMCDYYEKKYSATTGNYDIYTLFIEKSYNLINIAGVVSYILPHKFLISDYGFGVRNFLKKNYAVSSIIHFGSSLVFLDASTYTCILNISKENSKEIKFKKIIPEQIFEEIPFSVIDYNDLPSNKWDLRTKVELSLFNKLNSQELKLEDFINVFSGIQTSGDSIYILENCTVDKDFVKGYSKELKQVFTLEKEILKPIIKGNSIKRFSSLEPYGYVLFPYEIKNSNVNLINECFLEKNYPLAYEYLKKNEDKLRSREKGKMNKEGWYGYVYPKNLILSNVIKLVSPDITYGLNTTIDSYPFCLKNGAYGIQIFDKYSPLQSFILSILNCNLLWYFLKNTGNVLRGGYFRFNTQFINPFPIISPELIRKDDFDKNVNLIVKNRSLLSKVELKFQTYLKQKFQLEKLSKKLQNWHELEFGDFIKELNKAIKTNNKLRVKEGLEPTPVLTKKDEFDWLDLFEENKQKAQVLQTQINQTDKEIDAMVYELYGLTDEEIAIVENS